MLNAMPASNTSKNIKWLPVSIFERNRQDNFIKAIVSAKNNMV